MGPLQVDIQSLREGNLAPFGKQLWIDIQVFLSSIRTVLQNASGLLCVESG